VADALPFAAVAEGEGAATFIELGLILLSLAVLARLATAVAFSPVPLYLLAGLAFGDGGIADLGLTEDFVGVAASIGVVLLLFMLGLEYSAEELSAGLRTGSRSGLFDFLVNFLPGLGFGFLLGWQVEAAVLLGGITYISSSGIVAKLLGDLSRVGNRETPAILSILVMEDLVMAVYLPLVAVMLVGGDTVSAAVALGIAAGSAAVALTLALRFGRHISRALSHPSDEVLLLSTLALILLVSGVAEELQVSAAVGAFLVGIALSGSVAERAHVLLSPLRDLFAAVFFISFSLQIDPGEIPEVALAAIGLAGLTAATKVVTGWYAARRIGVGTRGRFRAGTALIARGEFSILLAALGVSAGVEPKLGALAAAYVLATAVGGPLLTKFSDPLVGFFQERAERRAGDPTRPAGW
jgi:CPA2 family monovalent cation:H+ antiporter-2